MHCMNIVLVGCDEPVAYDLRREALNSSVAIEAEFPDLQSAVDGLPSNPETPRLFIVPVRSNAELAQLKRLSVAFVGRPIIAIVDADRDATMVVKAMRTGAMQVVLLPFQRSDFGAAIECIAVQFGLAPVRAKTIAVAGATGGCGTTTIALNLAYELACMKNVKCVLMELSLRMGVLANHFNVQPRYTTSDLLVGVAPDRHSVNQVLTSITENLAILPGPYQSVEPGVIKSEDVLALVELAGHLAEVVIVDVPCTFDELYFKSLSVADSVVLVAEQKVASVRGVQMIREALPNLPAIVVLNRYDHRMGGFTAEKLAGLLNCTGLMTIARDPAVVAAGDQGRPLRLHASRSHALADVRKLMEVVAPEELPNRTPAKPASLLGRLSRAFTSPAKAQS